MQPVVLLTNPIHPDVHAFLETRVHVIVAPDTDPATLRKLAVDASVIIVRAPLPEALFSESPRLRGVIRHGAGIDMIPIEAASHNGIAVANAPKANALSVAEYVIGQMITLLHQLSRIDKTLRSDGWNAARKLADEKTEAAEKTVGIIGVGAIGSEVARICQQGLRMRVIGVRRSNNAMPTHVTPVSLEQLFAEADILVLACPINDSTRGLVSAARLASMKPGSFVINVSRGAVMDEAALIKVLTEKHLAGAALDVFQEQPLAEDSPLRHLPNVIISSHIAGVTKESMRRMGQLAAEQTLALIDGHLPKHLVNIDAQAAILDRLALLGKS